ncbi:putative zonadhesin [Apostichopus japonicus]|uniref:Putative zonadhesin n=1 Tax=Stichopus japonicus TaxID=307972 RepID=A0A2G8JIX2_STIJA|nr:putative zonadhesin [Apostichopus japonicus]
MFTNIFFFTFSVNVRKVFIGEVYLQLQMTRRWLNTSFINVLNIQRTAETSKASVLRPTLAEYTSSSQMDLKNHLRCTATTTLAEEAGRCKATCDDPNGQSGCNRDCLGSEGCTCPDGFLMQGSDCISASECGCFVAEANLVIPNGETSVNDDCTQKCSCNNNRLTCEDYRCSTDAVCDVRDGVRKCYCNEGYEGDGETCTSNVFTDCQDVYDAGQRQDGVYTIMPTGWPNPAFNVHCKMENGGGWTVIISLITKVSRSAHTTKTTTHAIPSTMQRSTEAAGGTRIVGALVAGVIAIVIISNTAAAASQRVLMTTSTASTMEATGK